jgi:hypothetical protein
MIDNEYVVISGGKIEEKRQQGRLRRQVVFKMCMKLRETNLSGL